MSVEQARALVKRAMEDEAFAQELEAAPNAERRAILEREGFGEVRVRHMSEVLPDSAGGELSDEEFEQVTGGMGAKGAYAAGDAAVGATAVAAAAAAVV